MVANLDIDCRTLQCFAVAHQLIQTLRPAGDLTDYPGLKDLAELLEVRLVEQIEKGGI